MNDETSKLIAKVERFARQEQLFAPAEPGRALHLCAAVSGGADSMALLRVLLPEPALPRVPVLLQPVPVREPRRSVLRSPIPFLLLLQTACR